MYMSMFYDAICNEHLNFECSNIKIKLIGALCILQICRNTQRYENYTFWINKKEVNVGDEYITMLIAKAWIRVVQNGQGEIHEFLFRECITLRYSLKVTPKKLILFVVNKMPFFLNSKSRRSKFNLVVWISHFDQVHFKFTILRNVKWNVFVTVSWKQPSYHSQTK